MAKTEKVRTTLRPDREIEVSPEEKTDLQRLGILKIAKSSGGAGGSNQEG